MPNRFNGLLNQKNQKIKLSYSKMGITVYILYSNQFNKTYVGQTNNLIKRLKYHNSGQVKSTKRYIPWEMLYFEEYSSRSEAMRREKWFKSKTGRKKISEILQN
ncbi:MAG: GIY-YIG nuclease family protein [Bacteroidota bacterium]|nr:GIY-YIG nuclease family protein [Bacteroidota bacterium]